MDLYRAVIETVYSRLTGDAALQSLCGGTVRLHLDMAPPDARFPYLVQRLTVDAADHQVSVEGPLRIDAWDGPNVDDGTYQPNTGRVLAIRGRVVALLDKELLTPAGVEAHSVQFWFNGSESGPTDAEDVGVFRHMIGFTARADRKAEVEAFIAT